MTLEQDSNISILVVDDEAEIIQSIKRLFQQLPYTLYFAHNGREALEVFADNDIDIVISDMRMPEMTGAELFEHLVQFAPYTYKILVTGYADLDQTVDAINKGAINKYIQKPWDNQDLLNTVHQGVRFVTELREISAIQQHADKQNAVLKGLSDNLQQKIDIRRQQIKELIESSEKEHKSIFRLFYSLITSHPMLDEHFAKTASHLAGFLATKMECTKAEIRTVRIATLLCEIGAIGLDEALLQIPIEDFTADQKTRFYQQNEHAKLFLQDFAFIANETKLVVRQYPLHSDQTDNNDDTPHDLLLSLLCCSRDLCRYTSGRQTGTPIKTEEAISLVSKRHGGSYDQRVVETLKTYSADIAELIDKAAIPKLVRIRAAKPGMVLFKSLYTKQQHLLLKAGAVLTPELIAKLNSLENQNLTFISVFTQQDHPVQET